MSSALGERPLIRHPGFGCTPVASCTARIALREPRTLLIDYVVTGSIGALELQPIGSPRRTDGLWRHTCFELFVGTGGSAYAELNFAPSGEWAAYCFDAYREGMRVVDGIAPSITSRVDEQRFMLSVSINLAALLAAPPWRIGLSAVIEKADGGKCYWALAHPPGDPDFHHGDCFALELGAPPRA